MASDLGDISGGWGLRDEEPFKSADWEKEGGLVCPGSRGRRSWAEWPRGPG